MTNYRIVIRDSSQTYRCIKTFHRECGSINAEARRREYFETPREKAKRKSAAARKFNAMRQHV